MTTMFGADTEQLRVVASSMNEVTAEGLALAEELRAGARRLA